MNDRLMEWESRVKQGLFEEEIFSEEMKHSVLNAVDRHSGYLSRQWRHFAGAVILGIVAVIVAINWPTSNADNSVSGSSDSVRLPVVFEPLTVRDWQVGQVIYLSDPDILPGLTNKYNPLRNETNGNIKKIPFSDIQLMEERPIDGFGTAYHYTLKPESTTPHEIPGNPDFFGFTVNGSTQPDTLYHYGVGHMYDQKFSMTRLFGQEVLKIKQDICRLDGESCVWYLKKDLGGRVYSYIDFEAASYERDLDGDGEEEAIVVTHQQNQIYIFKEQDGKLLWTSVREELQVNSNDSVQYDDAGGVFRIRSVTGEENVYAFQGDPNSFVRLTGSQGKQLE